MTKRWHIVVTKTGQEEKAEDNLGSQGFECYNAGHYVDKKIKGRMVAVKESLFPDYVFVRFDPNVQCASKINNTYGALGLLKFGDVLGVIADELVDAIKSRLQNTEIPRQVDLVERAKGEKFTIKDGILAGIEAIFIEPDGKTRSMIMLNMLGKTHQVTVDNVVIA